MQSNGIVEQYCSTYLADIHPKQSQQLLTHRLASLTQEL